MLQASETRHKCGYCGADAQFLCSGCRLVSYCTVECQGKQWKEHKPKCNKQQPVAKNNPLKQL